MSKGGRSELERYVQDLERKHPDWTARQIEAELAQLGRLRYAEWKEDTPSLPARLRQVQRWRSGQAPSKSTVRPLFQYLWPMGERQRQATDPRFSARPTRAPASHRLFLYNCSEETVREIRITLAGKEVGYEPVLAPGQFAEVPWFQNPLIREACLRAGGHEKIEEELSVEFAVSKGMRSARLRGTLVLDAAYGWASFRAHEGSEKSIY